MGENSRTAHVDFTPFECLLERDNKEVYGDNTAIYKIKRGTRLSVKAVKPKGGGFRLQVWNVAVPLGLIPEAYTDVICAAAGEYDVVCLAAGTVPLRKQNEAGFLIRVEFTPAPKIEQEAVEQEEQNTEPDDSLFEFRMDIPQAVPKEAVLGEQDFEIKQQPVYKTPWFILLACVLFLPAGLFLLWKFGRQTVIRKAFFSVFISVAVFCAFFGLRAAAEGTAKLISGDSYKQTANDFMLAWQGNEWDKMYGFTTKKWRNDGGTVYDVEQYFSTYSVVDSFETEEYYTDSNGDLSCVTVMYIDGVRYRVKITLKRQMFKYYVDVGELYEYMNRYSQTLITKQEPNPDIAGFVYCYADGVTKIYHYNKKCAAAGESLVRMPEREAIANGCGPCGRCAR